MTENQSGSFVAPDFDSDAYQKELERVNAAEASRKKGGGRKDELFFYKWKEENNLLFLPPWNPVSKELFKRVYRMYKLPPDKLTHMCIEKTYPDLGLSCPILAVLREAQEKSHGVKKLMPQAKNYWHVLDMDGQKQEVEIPDPDDKSGNKKIKVEIDFRYHPQICPIPPKCHDSIFYFNYNPDIGMFFDPYNAIPIEIMRKVGSNDIPEYSPRPLMTMEGGKKVPVRMPIADTPEEIVAIIGKIEGDKIVSGKLYDLDAIFKAPVIELKPEIVKEDKTTRIGKIWSTAVKLRDHFELDMEISEQNMPEKTQQAPGIEEAPKEDPPEQTSFVPAGVDEDDSSPTEAAPAPDSEDVEDIEGIEDRPAEEVFKLAIEQELIRKDKRTYFFDDEKLGSVKAKVIEKIGGDDELRFAIIESMNPEEEESATTEISTKESKAPRDMNTPEAESGGTEEVSFPGAPDCFNQFLARSSEDKSPCPDCPFQAVCSTMSAKKDKE